MIETTQMMATLPSRLIHYGFPVVAFIYFFTALTLTVCTLQTTKLRIEDKHVRRTLMIGLTLSVAAAYLAEALNVIIGVFAKIPAEQDRIVFLLSSSLIFLVEVLILAETKFPAWYPYYGTWFVAILAEITLIVAPNIHHGMTKPDSPNGYFTVVIRILRLGSLVALVAFYFALQNSKGGIYDNADAERQSLLDKKIAGNPSGTQGTAGYGTTKDSSEETTDADPEDSYVAAERKTQEHIAKRLQEEGNWLTYAKSFVMFVPYIWPYNNKMLQLRALLVGLLLLATNALHVLVPVSLGSMVDHLQIYIDASPGDSVPSIWLPAVIYAGLLFVSGESCIGWLRKWLWLPMETYSYSAIGTASHAHLMSLSSDFHDAKTSSELSQAIQGGRAVSALLETVLFQIAPTVIDLTVAVAFLSSAFGPYMGLILATQFLVYFYATTKLVSRRINKRREYITAIRKEWIVGNQSLDGWSTASLFNQIPYEGERYSNSVRNHMTSRTEYLLYGQTISAIQGGIMAMGLIGALFLGIYQVSTGEKTPGNFTTLLFYWTQVQSPLASFSVMYRSISDTLIQAERLLELFQTKPTIFDAPDAKTLELCRGQVKFNQVSFSYDERKPTLKDVTFEIPPGKTVALVGETGGGKTTILKLVDRFYDVKSGSITIDDQDIRDVTLESLREKIGVVPQDPMLFNDTVMNNLRYARLTATNDEIFEACKAAAVHDKIMSFPDGYNSKVGDRGVKLSGGEKQRVAIARAILKQPDIILLDEATSAVDTETESFIQKGLKALCQDRTTFIVAHRLSTIMRADTILVVMNGEIVEHGSHHSLLKDRGKYYDLWSKQVAMQTEPIEPGLGGHEREVEAIVEVNEETKGAVGEEHIPGTKSSQFGRRKGNTSQRKVSPPMDTSTNTSTGASAENTTGREKMGRESERIVMKAGGNAETGVSGKGKKRRNRGWGGSKGKGRSEGKEKSRGFENVVPCGV